MMRPAWLRARPRRHEPSPAGGACEAALSRRTALLAALSAFLFGAMLAGGATAEAVSVEVANASEPVLCAEKDNVTLNLTGPQVRRFQIEAVHPAYLGGLVRDSFEPDFTACGELTPQSTTLPPVRKVTFYEDVEMWLTGYSFGNFWRAADVPVRVGARVEHGLHLVQLWVRRNERAEEVLVLYPGDGYWRIRPLPPLHLGWTAYGSSVLIGPVEPDHRPVVKLKAVAFDPGRKTFTVEFAAGGRAEVALSRLDRDRIRLDVSLDGPVAARPFAALRSMYVTEFNADVARLALRDPAARAWRESGVLDFRAGRADEVWAGRLVPSRHNTSAPDIVFRRFDSTAAAGGEAKP